MIISEQEKKRILEMHLKSGYRTLINEQNTSPAELYKSGDREGLYELALSTDSESVKASPVYKNTLEWWLRGQGKVNALVGEKGRKSTDETQSLKSLYRWTGGDSAVGASSDTSKLDKYLNFIDQISQKKSDLIKSDPNSFNEEKFNRIESSQKILNQYKTKGIVMAKPELLIPNIDQLISDFKSNKFQNLKRIMDEFPKKVDEYAKIYNDKSQGFNTFWRIKSTITDQDKISILKEIETQSQNYWDNHKKVSNSIGGIVDIATDLYIAPKNESLGGTSTNETKITTIVGGYPGDANGVESPEWVEGHQLFPDDGIVINPETKTKINDEVKKSIDFVKSVNGKITSIKTWGFSSTSKVPTRYGSDNNQFSPDNNIRLSEDRLTAINAALAEAFKNNGIETTPVVDGNISQPNQGPNWDTQQRNNTAEYGVKGRRTEKYENEYGNWRYARAFFKITFEASTSDVQKTISADKLTKWNPYINWGREGMKISPPGTKTKTNGGFSKWDGQCPYFK
jgi:hypothetical protein